MFRNLCVVAFCLSPVFLHAQEVVTSPQVIPLGSDDGPAEILQKAAEVRASDRQLAYHREEFTAFVHFGPNTFTGKEWGNGFEDATVFNPAQVDTDQWCRALVAAGMKKVIITVKHHDGYCTWQTRYNDQFSVRKSPWKNGTGDVLKQLAASAQKFGLRLGVYLSPADLYQLESKTGLYGNLSKPQDSVIPTDPDSLQADPSKPRDVRKGLPVFQVKCDDYNRYFMNQLYELLTQYGPIHEVWFDGAHPKRKGGQTYDKVEWYRLIRRLQPQAVIFGGPDVRWCGNEHGGTRREEWNVLGMESLADCGKDRPAPDIGTDENLLSGGYKVYGKAFRNKFLHYLVAEVDTSIRDGWFWRNDTEQRVKNVDEVFDIYERAVGSGTVLLLNIPPNQDGQFSRRDVECLKLVGQRIIATYGLNLAAGAHADVPHLFDDSIRTFWQTPATVASCTIDFPQPQTINRIVVQEAVSEVGQRVKTHAVDVWVNDSWKQVATGHTIGYKKILRFSEVETQRLRLRILDARAPAAIATVSAHYYAELSNGVVLKHDRDGTVRLKAAAGGGVIRYTLDGTVPTEESSQYTQPLVLRRGGDLKAACFTDGVAGVVLGRRLGIATDGWKVVATSSQSEQWDAEKAIDGDSETFWHTAWDDGHPVHPHALTVELPEAESVSGFTYLPRQDRPVPDGMIERGYVEASGDGETWQKVCDFTFGNLVNSPNLRTKMFAAPVAARFFRLVSIKGARGKPFAAVAEFGLLAQQAD